MYKKILIFLLDFLIIGFVLLWIYLLYREFIELPRNSELLKFSIFQIKLILFTLFLISAITFLWFTNNKSEKEDSKISTLSKEIELLKNNILTKEEKIVKISEENIYPNIEEIMNSKNINELFENLFKVLKRITNADRISIEFYDFNKKELFIYKKNFELKDFSFDKDSLSYYVFKTEKRLFVTNIETHPILGRKNKDYYKQKSFMIFPVKIINRAFGVINISEKKENLSFNLEDFEKTNIIINIFSQKLENFIIYLSLEELINKKTW